MSFCEKIISCYIRISTGKYEFYDGTECIPSKLIIERHCSSLFSTCSRDLLFLHDYKVRNFAKGKLFLTGAYAAFLNFWRKSPRAFKVFVYIYSSSLRIDALISFDFLLYLCVNIISNMKNHVQTRRHI